MLEISLEKGSFSILRTTMEYPFCAATGLFGVVWDCIPDLLSQESDRMFSFCSINNAGHEWYILQVLNSKDVNIRKECSRGVTI